ncbi:hypothetical protein O3P69_005384 [Scylla paramamosain]|uniref:Uncharacterized protein n=1 Tax=Scylla paramamosain TaxID=85552 RepID=A0AAW0UBT0_SCYPA
MSGECWPCQPVWCLESSSLSSLVVAVSCTQWSHHSLSPPSWLCMCRQQKYAELYSTINMGEQPLKLLKLSEMRWLAIAPCLTTQAAKVVRDAMAGYCTMSNKDPASISKDENNYSADLLHQMYSDPANRLYLAFLQPVVFQVNRVNKIFMSDNCNINKLLVDLMSLYQSILQRLMMLRTFSTWKAVTDFDEISLQPGNSDDVHAYNTYMVRTGKIFTSCLQQDCCDNSWKGLEKLSPLSPRSKE